jgi:hypothetical protein
MANKAEHNMPDKSKGNSLARSMSSNVSILIPLMNPSPSEAQSSQLLSVFSCHRKDIAWNNIESTAC